MIININDRYTIISPKPLLARYGLREGFKHLEMKKLHDTSTKMLDETDIGVRENVPGYPQARETENKLMLFGGICFGRHTSTRNFPNTRRKWWSLILSVSIQKVFPDSSCFRLDPHQFGHPNNCARCWRILFKSSKKKWASPFSLSDLADILLAPKNSKLTLSAQNYFVASRSEIQQHAVREDDLTKSIGKCKIRFFLFCDCHSSFHFTFCENSMTTQDDILADLHHRSQHYHLSKFRAAAATKKIYDLSANVAKRRRTECVDGSMPCLTRSSQLWPHA